MTRSIVVMGVAGSGKTTVGTRLAEELGSPFVDADEHHSPENLAKMTSGQPLTDADREGWLDTLSKILQGPPIVLACSALKQSYRDRLGDSDFVYLRIEQEEAHARLTNRPSPHFPPNLLESQFEILEEPEDSLWLHASMPADVIIHLILDHLHPGAEK